MPCRPRITIHAKVRTTTLVRQGPGAPRALQRFLDYVGIVSRLAAPRSTTRKQFPEE